MGSTILVTGPSGKVGRRLVPLLARRGITVRAASRSPLPERERVEPARFDWADQSTYEAARKGVDAMYLVAGPVPQAEHAGFIRALLDGAAGTGVGHVVLLSTFGVDQAPPENPSRRTAHPCATRFSPRARHLRPPSSTASSTSTRLAPARWACSMTTSLT